MKGPVLLLVILAACAATVPLARGRLGAIADLRFRGTGLLLVALVVQIAILAVFEDGTQWLLRASYVATFAIAGAFIWRNRSVPGIPLIGIGGALNLVAIAANSGQMPARAGALEAAGRPVREEGFRNSAAVAEPRVPWLGDTFAIPDAVPLANVFSVGDVVIVLGVLVLLHVTCSSRLAWGGRHCRVAQAA